MSHRPPQWAVVTILGFGLGLGASCHSSVAEEQSTSTTTGEQQPTSGSTSGDPGETGSEEESSTDDDDPTGEGRAKPEGATFYVAKDGNDAWLGLYPEADPGDDYGPFATIEAAVAAMTEHKQTSPDQPASIQIREGTYYLSRTLVLGSEVSGTAEQPTTIRNYNGETVRISGGVELGGCTTTDISDSKTYACAAPLQADEATKLLHLLRIQATPELDASMWATKARWPRKPDSFAHPQYQNAAYWMYAEGKPSSSKVDGVNFTTVVPLANADVAALAAWDLGSAEIHFVADPYTLYNLPVHQFLPGEAALTVETGPYFNHPDLEVRSRFYVDNLVNGPMEPGDWALDKADLTVSYRTAGAEKFPDTKAVLTRLPRLVSIVGSPQASVKNIVLEGLVFSDTAYSAEHYFPFFTFDIAVDVAHADNVRVERNLFEFMGGNAVGIRQRSTNVAVRENVFRHLGQAAVYVASNTDASGWAQADAPTNNTIADNYIVDVANIIPQAAAIKLFSGSRTGILGNEVHDCQGPGIQLQGTPDSYSDLNKIHNNEVDDAMYGMADGGGIYISSSYAAMLGNEIIDNRVMNTRGAAMVAGSFVAPYGATSIYLDNDESGVIVQGNVASWASYGALKLHGGSFNQIVRNILVDGGDHEIEVAPNQPMQGNAFSLNVIGTTGANLTPANYFWLPIVANTSEYAGIFASGSNFYNLLTGDPNPPFSPGLNFSDWTALGFDTDSGLGVGDLSTRADGLVSGLKEGFLSSLPRGPSPTLLTGLRHFASSLPDGPAKTCLTDTLGPQLSPEPADALAVYRCLAALPD